MDSKAAKLIYADRDHWKNLSDELTDQIHKKDLLIKNLQEENANLQVSIGKYAAQIQEVIGKQQNLNREGLSIARNMLRGE